MTKTFTKLIAIVTLISTATSVTVWGEERISPSLNFLPNSSAAHTVKILSKRTALEPTELVKYQALALQSHELASRRAAGASKTTQTVLIVVGAVVVGLGVILLVATNGGQGVKLDNIGNGFAK